VFKDCIIKLKEDIKKKREKLNQSDARALLLLDGHPTRLQYHIWKDLQLFNTDVIIIPSHTSDLLQPLDLCVNGYFKQLLEKNRSFKKNEIKEKINDFLEEISNSIHKALAPDAIRKGFRLSYVCNQENDINLLEKKNEFVGKYQHELEISGVYYL
jgi:hypothetical protein